MVQHFKDKVNIILKDDVRLLFIYFSGACQECDSKETKAEELGRKVSGKDTVLV